MKLYECWLNGYYVTIHDKPSIKVYSRTLLEEISNDVSLHGYAMFLIGGNIFKVISSNRFIVFMAHEVSI